MANDILSVMASINKVEQAPCWIWRGAVGERGYGKVTVNYRSWLVHRYVYTQLVNAIPDDLTIDHLCGNKLCVNPKHLEAVTLQENILRYKQSITHCKNGHPLFGDNLYVDSRNRRECKTCRRAAVKRWSNTDRRAVPINSTFERRI